MLETTHGDGDPLPCLDWLQRHGTGNDLEAALQSYFSSTGIAVCCEACDAFFLKSKAQI
jgi:hypothetical protein